MIPAAPEEDIYNPSGTKRVAVYARVSTDDPNQTSSYELQKNHYQDYVNQVPNWHLVKIYADVYNQRLIPFNTKMAVQSSRRE